MNRRTLAEQYASVSDSPWKTFVVEVHPNGATADELLRDVYGGSAVSSTDDAYLHTVEVEDVAMTVDHLDDRFWSFHSTSKMADVQKTIRSKIATRRDLDFVWLPSEHLRAVWPASRPRWVKTTFDGWGDVDPDGLTSLSVAVGGKDADRLLDIIGQAGGHQHAVSVERLKVTAVDPDVGVVEELTDRRCRFVSHGDSFALHQEIVSGVVHRYRALVEAAEALSIGARPLGEDGGGRIVGAPIEIQFSRPLASLEAFLDHLFSAGEPFRLWGLYEITSGGFASCEAVDLHVGQCVRIEASAEWLRVHLYEGGCGNTVARLISNLQHKVDGALTMVDPTLQRLIAPVPLPAA